MSQKEKPSESLEKSGTSLNDLAALVEQMHTEMSAYAMKPNRDLPELVDARELVINKLASLITATRNYNKVKDSL